jgi:hypothetical protein
MKVVQCLPYIRFRKIRIAVIFKIAYLATELQLPRNTDLQVLQLSVGTGGKNKDL